MAWRETLYERPLRRPVDGPTLEAVHQEYHRRRHEIPLDTELVRDPARPERMTIKSRWLSFIIHFTRETLVVTAELSLAAKMFATAENRRLAVQFIDRIAEDLDL